MNNLIDTLCVKLGVQTIIEDPNYLVARESFKKRVNIIDETIADIDFLIGKLNFKDPQPPKRKIISSERRFPDRDFCINPNDPSSFLLIPIESKKHGTVLIKTIKIPRSNKRIKSDTPDYSEASDQSINSSEECEEDPISDNYISSQEIDSLARVLHFEKLR